MNILQFIEDENINGFTKDGGTDKVCDHSYCLTLYPDIMSVFTDRSCSVLEVGTYKGGWAYTLLKMLPQSKVTCVDIQNLFSEELISRLTEEELSRLTFIEGDGYSDSVLSMLAEDKYDLIFEDGPHTLATQTFAVKNLSRLLTENGTLVIEDIPDDASLNHLIDCVDRDGFEYRVVDLRHVINRFDDLVLVIRRKP